VCIHRDGMDEVYPKLRSADILVLGTPVYSPLPGRMQDFLNRLCPLLEPILEERHDRTRVRFRDDVRIGRIALVAASGWWELANMDIVKQIAEELAANAGVPFAGAVLRPHAYVMKRDPEVEKRIMKATRSAGRELVQVGAMSDDTLREIARPLISFDECRREQTEAYLSVKNSV